MMFKGIMKLLVEFFGQDFTNPIGVITNFVILQHIIDLMMKFISEGPKDLTACGGLYTEGAETVGFVIKHINPMSLVTNIAANSLTHILDLLGDAWKLLMAIFTFNFYEIGRVTGEIIMMIIG